MNVQYCNDERTAIHCDLETRFDNIDLLSNGRSEDELANCSPKTKGRIPPTETSHSGPQASENWTKIKFLIETFLIFALRNRKMIH